MSAPSTVRTGPAPTPARGTSAGRPRKHRGWRQRFGHPAFYLFPLPALVVYVIFFAVPTVQAFQYAVTDWDGYSAGYRSVGLDNFEQLARGDDLFVNAMTNSLKFMLVVVVFQTLFSLVLASMLLRNSRSSTLLRAVFFLPTILSSVSVAFVWKFIYDPNFGLANSALKSVGLDSLTSSFLGDEGKAIYFLAITQVWFHTGQMMVIFIAGLQQIPRELYEAAAIDGVGRWQRFRHVTWPMIAPATGIVIAYTTIQSFKAFDLVLGLGGNPPQGSLDILSTRIYTSFADSRFGYAAAESIVFMAVIALVTLIQRRTVKLTQSGA
ncbi:sugar ABC transporter permease [Streptomyces sp. WMMB303]|uniref:carbohydrate ABC transporter permease n=1 Tax=Streptomyces sp. WMMB303 TaxID=3034154 RepID=UPI0023EB77B7|nr:sugar ABC transporter permease [Streptomyces sp. WMMB303]MDF4249593.1 sugar ABC transporter permease [Streptomyces sp. WMMB303]